MADESNYNATVTSIRHILGGGGLAIMRVVHDDGPITFTPGQYTTLGLLGSAPRVEQSEPESEDFAPDKMIKRAYSIGSSPKITEYLEFYLVLVPEGSLTPRLYALEEGDRLWMAKKAVGSFTLDHVPEDRDLVLIGTGTGIAPFISMLRTDFVRNDGRNWAIVHGVRKSPDFSYHEELTDLSNSCDNFFYLPAITRPDGDPWQGLVGRLPKLVMERVFEREWGREFDAAGQSVFLCGHPGMIEDVSNWLGERGFSEWNRSKNPDGNVHFEKYW